MGMVFDIRRFAVHDGPGIRTTVFLKGCSLGCLWCQNPEGLHSVLSLWHIASRCISCRACEHACPRGAISFEVDGLLLARGTCNLCGTCVAECPAAALAFDGRQMSAREVIDEVLTDRAFYDVSGGGLTVSGGEPLSQHEFTREILTLARHERLHTAIETSLYAAGDVVESLMPLTDLFIVDLKIADEAQHRRYTGAGNSLIEANLRRLVQAEAAVKVRVPLIPGATDTELNVRALARFALALDADMPVELVNFNPHAETKYRRLGLPWLYAGMIAPLPETMLDRMRSVVEEERAAARRSSPRPRQGRIPADSRDGDAPLLAIDIGGTKTRLAWFSEGRLEPFFRMPTPQDPRGFVGAVQQAVEASGKSPAAIGVGCPGPLDQESGEVCRPPALPLWDRFPIARLLAQALGAPAMLENDANLGALGEAVFGSGRGFSRVFYLTVSTGIGTGFVIDRRIYRGSRGLAGEIWSFEPGLFTGVRTDIINDIASGSGMVKHALKPEHALGNIRDAVDVLEEAERGREAARHVVEEAQRTLAAALCFVISVLDPDLVVMGGGLCAREDRIVVPVARMVHEHLRIDELKQTPIRRAELWEDAVLLGAAALADQQIEISRGR